MTNSTVEIQFQLHASRPPKRESPEQTVVSRPGALPRITQVLATAIQFEQMIAEGEARHYADLARLGCITRERVSQIMELLWLAPDIQQEILELPPTTLGRFPIGEVAVRHVASNMDWTRQRDGWNNLKKINHIE
jgi:hypothetical protein